MKELKKELFEILKNKKLSKSEMIDIEFLLDQAFDLGYDDAMISYGLKDREDV